MFARFSTRVLLAILLAATALSASSRAEVNLLSSGPLVVAAEGNSVSDAEALLARGANPNALGAEGRTALILAAAKGYEDMVELLVRHRAALDRSDKFGNTALFYAAAGDHSGVVEILIEAGARKDKANRRGVTPLMVAASEGGLATVRALLDAGADPAVTDFTGRTAYHWAERGRRGDVMRLLAVRP